MVVVAAAVLVAVVVAVVAAIVVTRSSNDQVVSQADTDPADTDPADTDPGTDGGLTSTPEIAVINTYEHDATYTQGLEFIDDGPHAGLLLESGGQWGESLLRIWDPATGEIVHRYDVDDALFAEGATIVDNQVWQLTWRAGTALRYDLDTLAPTAQVSYEGEGWGLCRMGPDLIMSDGSSRLTFRDPDSFSARSTVEVTRNGQPVDKLNELECVSNDQLVWANIYQSTEVVAIDPGTGNVVRSVDAAALVPDDLAGNNDLVLNGIAHDPNTGHLWLTGKRWPVLYEIELRY